MAKNSVPQSYRINFAGPSPEPLLLHFFQVLPSDLGKVGALITQPVLFNWFLTRSLFQTVLSLLFEKLLFFF